MSNRPKVLYIMGTGRSGSTILEILLSASSQVFGAGELTSIVEDGFRLNKPCSCGRPCSECDVWGEVLSGLGLTSSELNAWAKVQHRVDWHDGFFRQFFHFLPKRDIEQYRAWNVRLFNAISKASDCSIVLDSSKYAGRALALMRIVQADVKVICLTRSPVGLMASFQKPNMDEQRPKSALAVMVYYMVTLASLRIASLLLGKHIYHISYEALLADPEGTLLKIEDWTGINLLEARQRLQARASFTAGHLVTGNRLRKKGAIKFNPKMGNNVPKGIAAKGMVKLMNGWQWMLGFSK